MGKDMIVVFTAGASGDVTQIDNLDQYQRREAEELARFVGGRIGAEVVKVLFTQAKGTDVKVDNSLKVLKILRRAPRKDRLQAAIKLLKNPPANANRTQLTFAKETVLLDSRLAKEPIADVEV